MNNSITNSSVFKKSVLAGVFATAGVVLSFISFPLGPVRCFPFQHTINVVAGVTLGPWWALGAAFTTSLIRNLAGTGTLFAFPGSMFGALFVGVTAWAMPERYKAAAAVAEPIGTGIAGAWVSSAIVAPIIGKSVGFAFLSSSFLASCVPGAFIGAAVLYILRNKIKIGVVSNL